MIEIPVIFKTQSMSMAERGYAAVSLAIVKRLFTAEPILSSHEGSLFRGHSKFQRLGPSDGDYKNLAVADTARASGADDAVSHFLDTLVTDADTNLNLG